MKTIRLLCAALLPLVTAGNAPAEPKPLPWLVAQRMASCELENRKVPVGTRLCSSGSVIECSPSGTWQNTGKEC
jgi:hypothetical protein